VECPHSAVQQISCWVCQWKNF